MKKGFTLIELLAIIIILGIIAGITVTNYDKIIDKNNSRTKELAIKSIVEGLKKSRIENSHYETFTATILNNELYYYINDEKVLVDYNGTLPTSGTIKIYSDGDYESKVIYDDCYIKTSTKELEIKSINECE